MHVVLAAVAVAGRTVVHLSAVGLADAGMAEWVAHYARMPGLAAHARLARLRLLLRIVVPRRGQLVDV